MKKSICLLLMVSMLMGSSLTSYAATPSLKINLPKIPNITNSVNVPNIKVNTKYIPKININASMFK